MTQISDAFEQLIENKQADEKIYSSICKVISVNEENRTCELEPINGDAERTGRLQASLSLSEGIFIKPVINSFVLLSFINNQTGIITNYSEVERVYIKVGGSEYDIIDGDIIFNSGSDNAVRFSELKTGFDQLKQDFNKFVTTIYNVHVHPGVLSGGASTLITTNVGTSTTASIDNAKIDNIKVP